MRHPVPTLNTAQIDVPPLWLVPTGLAALLAKGHRMDLLFIHIRTVVRGAVPHLFEGYPALLHTAARAAGAQLCRDTRVFGLHRCPPDDLIAWTPHVNHDDADALDKTLATSIREALEREEDGMITSRHPLDVNVIRVPISEHGTPDFAFAAALRRAGQAAYDPSARETQRARALMDEAIEKLAFCFHYQPIVDVVTGETVAYEALCRGLLDDLRFPDVIFATAERSGRVWELGRALRDLAATSLHDATAAGEDIQLFVNVHPADVDDPMFLEQALNGPLALYADKIVIELTERAAISDYKRVKRLFTTLRDRGYRLAIDDLGSGYAGLTALAELEPDFIKFDMALIRDLHLHPVKRRLIGRMNDFALEIGASTISEGVETREERDALLDARCNRMQGYFFARPSAERTAVSPDKFQTHLHPTGRA